MFKRIVHHLNFDARWFPPMLIDAPDSFNLQTLCDEFMLNDSTTTSDYSGQERPSPAPFITAPPRYTIEVFNTQARPGQFVSAMQMPTLSTIYKGPSPGQMYDFAAIKFRSNNRSRLWLSTAIPAQSNYFLNMARIPLAHAAATQGSGLLHSALVEYDGMGILLPGAAFSGKSSIAVFSMLTGAKLIGDDLVLLSPVIGDVTIARSFRRTLLMRQRTHDLLPDSIRTHARATNIGDVIKYAYDRRTLGPLTDVETTIQRIVLPSISVSKLKHAEHGYQLRRMNKASAVQQLVRCLDSSVLMPGLEKERSKVTVGLLNLVARTPCIELNMDARFLTAPKEHCQRLLRDIASMKTPVAGISA